MIEKLGMERVFPDAGPETGGSMLVKQLSYGIRNQVEAMMIAVGIGSGLEFSYGHDQTFNTIISGICIIIFVAGYFLSQMMIEMISKKSKGLRLFWPLGLLISVFLGDPKGDRS